LTKVNQIILHIYSFFKKNAVILKQENLLSADEKEKGRYFENTKQRAFFQVIL